MGEDEQGGATGRGEEGVAGMTTYSRQETWLPWRRNKDVCIRGKSQQSAVEGTSAARAVTEGVGGGL